MLRLIFVIFTMVVGLVGAAEGSRPGDLWSIYKQQFISSDGRVIDHFQDSNSHSEGQGYGLLLATIHRDRKTFDRILQWTEANLQVRRDELAAWSWGKRPNGHWQIIDYNNATDGDILIAFALLKAHEAWREESYRQKALPIIKDIRKELAWKKDGYLVLAPAYYGFENGAGLIINNGYMVFSAFEAFAKMDDRHFWQTVRKDSLRLLGRNKFSRFQLPADWVILKDGRLSVHSAQSPFFGYEAIRIPLYLTMAGEKEHLAQFSDYLTFIKDLGYLPNRINLIEGTISADEAPAGFYAVISQCAYKLGYTKLARKLDEKAAVKIKNEPKDYFSFTLYLLAKVAL